MNIITSALGHYEARGHVEDADVLVGHSFGTLTGKGSVNRRLAECILECAGRRPIVVDKNLADAFPSDADQIDLIVGGPVSDALGGGVGTWGTLLEAGKFMNDNELLRPLMVAQACHIGRVAMQAFKQGMDPIIPPDLPAGFDPESEQRWTRSKSLWVPREVIGSFVLRSQGKL